MQGEIDVKLENPEAPFAFNLCTAICNLANSVLSWKILLEAEPKP